LFKTAAFDRGVETMYDWGLFQAASIGVSSPSGHYDRGVRAISRAHSVFNGLFWRAQLAALTSMVRGRNNRLLDLDDVRNIRMIESMHELGCVTVELKKIRGSECRVCDFDADFRPLTEATRERWQGVYAARMAGVTLPAVSLVQVGDTYYVRDGHHRISVARVMGEEYIDAIVQVWQVRGEPSSVPALGVQLLASS